MPRTIYLDLETNTKHDTVWCAASAFDKDLPEVIREPAEMADRLGRADTWVNHNVIGFDAPVLERVYGIKVPFKKLKDTLVMSYLWNPELENGHSLDAWGKRLNCLKGDFRDYDAGFSEEMAAYAKQDVALNRKVDEYLTVKLAEEGFSAESIALEHQVAYIVQKQVARGVFFDYLGCKELLATVNTRMAEIEAIFQERFPPRLIELWSVKTKKALKPYSEPFNIGSRPQVVEKLFEIGAGHGLKARTETGRYKLSEEVLKGIDIAEAKLVAEFMTLQKRQGQMEQWLKYCTPAGRIHGRVITCGAVSGRMTHHSPSMAQVPHAGSYLGHECRRLFMASPGMELVGADAAALELCMLAHYMRDDEFTKAVVEGKKEDGTDVHTRNQKAAGLPTRDAAKTFIYALMYGAGPAKIGSIVGGGYEEGRSMTDRFMANMPKFRALKDKVDRMAASGTLPGLDGRKLRVRSAHSALNTLLQGAGAIVMKQALVILYRKLYRCEFEWHFVLNVHDEWQIEVAEGHGHEVGKMAVESIKEAGEVLGLRCALSGEYKVGKTWEDTH